MLFLLLTSILVGIVVSKRLNNFEVFYFSHKLTYVFLVLNLLHCPKVINWTASSLFLLALDLYLSIPKRSISSLQFIGNIIGLSCPDGHSFPGSYYSLCIPAISSYEWHPFSNTSASGISFLVSSNGLPSSWTTSLLCLAQRIQSTPVLFRGPFYSPSVGAINKSHSILVALGIGATPMISIIRSYIAFAKAITWDETLSSPFQKIKRLDFFWVLNSPEQITWLTETIDEVMLESSRNLQLCSVLHFHFTLTSLTSLPSDYITQLACTALTQNTPSAHGVSCEVFIGRTNWYSALTHIVTQSPTPANIDLVSFTVCQPVPIVGT